ncbi:tetratricopeptide repeat protein [Alkalinema pantanalense CENA528]|uniref:tetratricopeptide repeat protein n=1 Tax=Alkalinema pantanalense TaxID=1620705 RepID=UPI003D6DC239
MVSVGKLFIRLVLLSLVLSPIACQKQETTASPSTAATPPSNSPNTSRTRHTTTIAQLDSTLKQNPKDVTAYRDRGRHHFALGERLLANTADPQEAQADLQHLQAALKDFNQVIQYQPKDAETYNDRGQVYLTFFDRIRRPFYDSEIYQKTSDGNKDDGFYAKRAIADFNQAIKLNPNNAAAYKYRGMTQLLLGDLQKAAADLNQAITLDPKDAEAYKVRGMAFFEHSLPPSHEKDHVQKALADLNQAIQLKPNYPEAYIDRGNVLYSTLALGKKQPALNDYHKAIELYRQQGNPQSWLEESLPALEAAAQ